MNLNVLWYVAVEGKQEGPLPESEVLQRINAGQLNRDAYVFKEGMVNWVPLAMQPEFSDAFQTIKPPPPPPVPSPPPTTPTAPRPPASSFVRAKPIRDQPEERGFTATRTEAREPAPAKVKENIPRRYRKGIRGTVRSPEQREVSGKGFSTKVYDYLSFRLERTDSQGNVIEQIPVELRAEKIPGLVIKAGDAVIIKGRRTTKGYITPRWIYVVDTKSVIRGKKMHGYFLTLLSVPLGLAAMVGVLGLIVGVIMLAGGEKDGAGVIGFSIAAIALYILIYVRD